VNKNKRGKCSLRRVGREKGKDGIARADKRLKRGTTQRARERSLVPRMLRRHRILKLQSAAAAAAAVAAFESPLSRVERRYFYFVPAAERS